MKAHPSPRNEITWRGPGIDDEEMLAILPVALFEQLRATNGFILNNGVLHLRGACHDPHWHSLRKTWQGSEALHLLYEDVLPDDIPFAQDAFGDQFLLRNATVLRLFAETGEIEDIAPDLESFIEIVHHAPEQLFDLEAPEVAPGELLLAYPPFSVVESDNEVGLTRVPALEAIRFHAEVARQLKDVPEGAKIKFNVQ